MRVSRGGYGWAPGWRSGLRHCISARGVTTDPADIYIYMCVFVYIYLHSIWAASLKLVNVFGEIKIKLRPTFCNVQFIIIIFRPHWHYLRQTSPCSWVYLPTPDVCVNTVCLYQLCEKCGEAALSFVRLYVSILSCCFPVNSVVLQIWPVNLFLF
jgi:hypothetical protein